VFRLSGLSERSPYYNLRCVDLKETDQRKLRGSVLRAVNIKQLTPKADNFSVYHIFERLNTGGTALKPQEIRNCVYRGEIVTSLRTLNLNSNWRKLLGKVPADKHQRDVELVLRLFSFYQDWARYEKPMKEFLNSSMRYNTKFDSAKAKRFMVLFPQACDIIVRSLGEKRGPLNTSVLDAVFCAVLENGSKVDQDFKIKFRKLIENPNFEEKIRIATTDTATVRDRLRLAKTIV
jgi:hypothetical protein